MSNNTDSKEKYIRIWKAHIKQLGSLSMPLMDKDIELYQELLSIQERLDQLVDIAAEEDFK